MKKIFVMFVVFVGLLVAQSDCYTVLQIKGTILNAKTKKAINRGDNICSTNEIVFKDKDEVMREKKK